nr:hypothetical protein BaRGS_030660 [Batillaria attramentaria]
MFWNTFAPEYASDIYDNVVGDIEAKGLDCEVLGGGRIEHEPHKKAIKIYGYSQEATTHGEGARISLLPPE